MRGSQIVMNRDYKGCVGGLLPIATTQSKGLMSAYDKYGQYSITKAETANDKCILLCTVKQSCDFVLNLFTFSGGYTAQSRCEIYGSIMNGTIKSIGINCTYPESIINNMISGYFKYKIVDNQLLIYYTRKGVRIGMEIRGYSVSDNYIEKQMIETDIPSDSIVIEIGG